jgi:hypothetical protein
MSAPRCYTPTDSDADPQGLIAPHYQAFIDRIGERAVELAASQGDDAEDYVLEYLDSYQVEFDYTFDALIRLFRNLNIIPDDQSIRIRPSTGATHATPNNFPTSPPDTQVNVIAGHRLGNFTTATQTPEDGSDEMLDHGNENLDVLGPFWPTRLDGSHATFTTMGGRRAFSEPVTTMTAPLHRNGFLNARSINENGIPHPISAGEVVNPAQGDGMLLPRTTYAPPAVSQQLGAQGTMGVNGNGAHHALELSDDSPDSNNGSVTSTTNLTSTQHVFQLPFLIDGGSSARLQTISGHFVPQFGSMSFVQRGG